MLSLKEEYILRLWSFLIIWFNIISLSIAPPEVFEPANFLPKDLQTNEASPHLYPSYFGFLAILTALSRETLLETLLLNKSLKYL